MHQAGGALLYVTDAWCIFLGNNISVDTTYDFEDRKDEMSIL